MNINKEARKSVELAALSCGSFHWGDLIDFTDTEKDLICKEFLKNDFNWCDDLLPPMVDRENYSEWIEFIYGYHVGGKLHTEYRNAIYLYLEDILSQIISELKAEIKFHGGE